MEHSKVQLIYLLGAGRSGTTLMATLLDTHPKIRTLGEMHQFFQHVKDEKNCSCGLALKDCPFWGNMSKFFVADEKEISKYYEYCERKEKHKNIPAYLISSPHDPRYSEPQKFVFSAIKNHINSDEWLLDSSKYIARFLLLKDDKAFKLKGIYMVRDVRGVITSFKKKVQTSRQPLSAIFYYLIINFFGQIVCWLDNDVIKVRYEDLVLKPEETLSRIYGHVYGTNEKKISLPEYFVMPHLIGGNRMKEKSKIRLNLDEKWRNDMSRWNQIIYYLLAFPTMVLNRYNI